MSERVSRGVSEYSTVIDERRHLIFVLFDCSQANMDQNRLLHEACTVAASAGFLETLQHRAERGAAKKEKRQNKKEKKRCDKIVAVGKKNQDMRKRHKDI